MPDAVLARLTPNRRVKSAKALVHGKKGAAGQVTGTAPMHKIRFGWHSLSVRLTLAALAIFLAAVWSLTVYVGYVLRGDMERLIGAQQISTAALAAGDIDDDIRARLSALARVAAEITPAILADHGSVVMLLRQRPLLQYLFNGGLRVFDPGGFAIAAVPAAPALIGLNYLDRPHLAAALKRGVASVGEPVMGGSSGHAIFGMAVPVRDAGGRVIAALSGVTDLSGPNFLDRISAARYGNSGGFVVVAPAQRLIVTASDKRLVMTRALDAGVDPLVDRFMGGGEGSGVMVNSLGIEVLAAARRIPAAGWYVAVALPTAEALAPLAARLQHLLAVALLLSVLGAAATWWMVQRQLAPVLDTARRLAALPPDGAFTQTLPEIRADEVGALIGAFNRLLKDLRESQRMTQGLIEALAVPVFFKGRDGRYLGVNRAWEAFFGRARDTIVGKPMEEIFADDPERSARMLAKDAQLWNQPGTQQYEASITAADGRRRTAIYAKATFTGAQGEVAGLIGTILDVTEHKMVEQALREREHELQVVMDAVPALITRLDRDQRFRFVNRGYAEMIGRPAGDIVGKLLCEVNDSATYALSRPHIDAVLAGATVRFERPQRHAGGSVSHLEVTFIPDRNAAGTVCGWFGMHRDITRERVAMDRRAESEQRYRTLTEWTPEAIMVHRDGKILYVNPAAVRLFGADAAGQLFGSAFFERFHPDSRALARVRVQALLDGDPRTPLVEMTFLKLDGTPVAAEIQGTRLNYDGAPAIHVSIHDISARVSLEAQLREAQKMQAIGTLAGGIAHDFNNIIATILGNVQLARDDARGNLPALESLEEIRKAGSRARDLVQQILSFSRRQPTDKKPLALMTVVDETVRLLQALLPARIRLEARCAPGVPRVLADATQIGQVLINLATNAMQALHDAPGLIRIRLDSALLDAALAATEPALAALHGRHPGVVVHLSVEDDGPGMDAATRSRIFEPFFTTKPVNEGTGLGLSVVHGIVQGHEGVIVVASAPGQGTRFDIYLPALASAPEGAAADGRSVTMAGSLPQPAVPELPAVPPLPGSSAGRHILYLDDDPALVLLLRRLLERQGYRVSAFTSQAAALAAVRATPDGFDLVVTDYNMPGMSGLEVVRQVRAINARQAVVIASGFVDDALRSAAAAAGADDVILKASAAEDFCAVLEHLLPLAAGQRPA